MTCLLTSKQCSRPIFDWPASRTVCAKFEDDFRERFPDELLMLLDELVTLLSELSVLFDRNLDDGEGVKYSNNFLDSVIL